MKRASILLMISLTHNLVAFEHKSPNIVYESQSYTYPETSYWGIIDTSETGTLHCFVTYNSLTRSYDGTAFNDGWQPTWFLNLKLSTSSARYYYQQLQLMKKNQ